MKRKTLRTAAISAVLSGLILSVISCQKGTSYHHSTVFKEKGWDMNDAVCFSDSLPSNTPDRVHLELNLRHSNNYPYQNLWLYIQTATSDSLIRNDSVNWILANPNGRWLGSGWGSFYNISYRLPDLFFPENDSSHWFRIEISHGLRDSLLTGLADLGLRIYTDTEE